MKERDKRFIVRDLVRVVLLVGPIWFMSWYDNWTSFQLFMALDLGFILGLLHDLRKEMGNGSNDTV